MIIIPFASRMNFKPLPWATIALIAINCFVLFFVQGNEEYSYKKAIDYYSQSMLPSLEIPAFASYLENEARGKEARWIRQSSPHKLAKSGLALRMQKDGKFIAQLHHHVWVKKDSPHFQQWQNERGKFEQLLSQIVTEEYSYKPDAPEISDMLASIFLHAGFGHLLGNMVFLFLLGFVVERLVGSAFMLLIYFVGGIFAAISFGLFASGEGTSVLGASGAVSALMGAYIVFFGWRKIPFFYSVGFYFDYIKAPAFVLLIAFLVKEIYFHLTGDNQVAYMAHVGGLLAGAILGFALKSFLDIPVDAMLADLERDEQGKRPPWQSEFDRAMTFVEKMKLEQANEILARLNKRFPEDQQLLREWFKVGRNNPSTPHFHQSAREIFLLEPKHQTSAKEIHDVYQEYIMLAKPRPKLERNTVIHLASVFSRMGFLENGEKLLNVLMKKPAPSERLDEIALILARKLRQANQPEKAETYFKWILKYSNDTAIVKQAKALLSN